MWKELSAYFVIFLLVALFGGYAWLTHHPETPWLEEAETWPGVGVLAEAFRDYYLPPEESTEEPAGVPLVDIVYVDEDGNPIEGPLKLDGPTPSAPSTTPRSKASQRRPSPRLEDLESKRAPLVRPLAPEIPDAGPETASALGSAPYLASGREWFVSGQPILPEPDRGAEPDRRLPKMAFLPVLSRDGFWAEVFFDGEKGWVDTTWEPDHDRKKARRGARLNFEQPVRGRDRRRLVEAKEALGLDEPNRQLGSYELYTDVHDEALLAFLDGLASKAEDAYFSRYGRVMTGDPLRSIVLFSNRSDYDRFAPIPGAGGHASGGVAMLHAVRDPDGGFRRESVARTLLHELTHLMNSRAMHSHIPVWLEEGLASDLSTLWVQDSKEVMDPEAGGFDSLASSPIYQDADSSILHLWATIYRDRLPPTSQLLTLRREAFYAPANIAITYSHAAGLVRFLLDGENQGLRPGFLSYLDKVAKGHLATPELLLAEIGIDGDTLHERMVLWVRAEGKAIDRAMRKRARS